MAKNNNLTDFLTSLANKFRTKLGLSNLSYNISSPVSEITIQANLSFDAFKTLIINDNTTLMENFTFFNEHKSYYDADFPPEYMWYYYPATGKLEFKCYEGEEEVSTTFSGKITFGKINPQDFDDKIDAVFNTGKQKEYDDFWNMYQSNGHKANYMYNFAQSGWRNGNLYNYNTFNPKYTIRMYAGTVTIDGKTYSGHQNAGDYTFYWATCIKTIDVKIDVNDSNPGSSYRGGFVDTFYGAQNLEKIANLDITNYSGTFSRWFNHCNHLTDIDIDGYFNGDWDPVKAEGKTIDIHWSPLSDSTIESLCRYGGPFGVSWVGAYKGTFTVNQATYNKMQTIMVDHPAGGTISALYMVSELGWTVAVL